jgi:hypothetical protein
MDLYQPLFVPRPTVEPELFASLRPPTYESASPRGEDRKQVLQREALGAFSPNGRTPAAGKTKNLSMGFGLGDAEAPGRDAKAGADGYLDLRRGLAEAATASNLGDYFEYAIDHAVSLARQKSAMLPLVNRDVEAGRVSIYNERVHAKFPLLGLRLKNDTGLHLTQGPITVFEGNNYAGDTRILDLQPGEERLVSYAIDLGTDVHAVPGADNGKLTAVKLRKGILYTTNKQHESKTYTLTNRSGQDRTVLIEHPYRPDFTLTSSDKPAETARDVYRFEVKLPKGETAKRTVSEERLLKQEVVLTNLDDNRIRLLISDTASSSKVKEALQAALQKRGKLAQTQQEIANQKRELDAIKTEQPRLRANLEKIPLTDPLAKRILEKLNKQETEIETYESQIKQLNARADQERKDFEDFLAQLNVE